MDRAAGHLQQLLPGVVGRQVLDARVERQPDGDALRQGDALADKWGRVGVRADGGVDADRAVCLGHRIPRLRNS